MATNREIVYILRLQNQSRQGLAGFSSSLKKVIPEIKKISTALRKVQADSRKTSSALKKIGTGASGIRKTTTSLKQLNTQGRKLGQVSKIIKEMNTSLRSAGGNQKLRDNFKRSSVAAREFSTILAKIQTQFKSINASSRQFVTLSRGVVASARQPASRRRAAVPGVGRRATGQVQRAGKAFKETTKHVGTFRDQIRRSAAAIALLDGPLGGIASRVTAVGTLFGSSGAAAALGIFSLAMAGVTASLIGAVSAGAKLERQQNRLQALLVTTGNAANQTVESIETISRSIGIETLASTRDVRDAAAQLLTFKSISGDAFETTLRLAQDLAETGFGTLKTQTIQLAKALEDPILGLNALRRSGVSFSVAQKKVIEDLVNTGQQAKAQGIILEGIARQVEGAGKAAATGVAGAFDTLKERLNIFLEDVAKNTDILETVAGALLSVANAIKFLSDNIETVTQVFKGLGVVILTLIGFKILSLVIATWTFFLGGFSAAAIKAAFSTGVLRTSIAALFALIIANPFAAFAAAIALTLGALVATNAEIEIFGERIRIIDIVIAAYEELTNRVIHFGRVSIQVISLVAKGEIQAAKDVIKAQREKILALITFLLSPILAFNEAFLAVSRNAREIAKQTAITIFGIFAGLADAIKEAIKGNTEESIRLLKDAIDFDFDDSKIESVKEVLKKIRDTFNEATGKVGSDILENARKKSQEFFSEIKKEFDNIKFGGAQFEAASPEAVNRLETFRKKVAQTLKDFETEVILARQFGKERAKSLALIKLANDAIKAGLLDQKGGLEEVTRLLEAYSEGWEKVQKLTEGTEGAIRGVKAAVTEFVDSALNDFETFKDISEAYHDFHTTDNGYNVSFYDRFHNLWEDNTMLGKKDKVPTYTKTLFTMQLSINEGLQRQLKSLQSRITHLELINSGLVDDVRYLKDVVVDEELPHSDFSGCNPLDWGRDAESK